MASSNDAFFGKLSGKIGNIVVYQMYGKTVIRSLPTGRSKKASPKLEASRTDFKTVVSLLPALKHLLAFGFGSLAVNRSAYQAALSVNLKSYQQAMDKSIVDWLILSKGEREPAIDPQAVLGEAGTILLSWSASPVKSDNSTDKLVVFLLSGQALSRSAFEITDAQRHQGHASVRIPATCLENTIEVFVSFISSSYLGKQLPAGISSSCHAGTLTIK